MMLRIGLHTLLMTSITQLPPPLMLFPRPPPMGTRSGPMEARQELRIIYHVIFLSPCPTGFLNKLMTPLTLLLLLLLIESLKLYSLVCSLVYTSCSVTYKHTNIYHTGNCDVGKSSLIFRLCEGHFTTDSVATVGLDFYTKLLTVGEEQLVFQLWDTAGQER